MQRFKRRFHVYDAGMETLTANLLGTTRKATLNGREYIVAPMRMMVPGVLNGSQGALFYPPEEVSKDPSAWNAIPIVNYHPVRNGQNVSARDPEVLEAQGLGFVFAAHTSDTSALEAEAWVDIEAAERVDNRIIDSLNAGSPIELSTGLFTDNEPAEQGAVHNGVSYTHVARNHRPDHLAFLPDQVGACSLADGCGVLVNSGGKQARVHKENDAWLTANEMSHSELHNKLAAKLRETFAVSDEIWVMEVFDYSVIYEVGDDKFRLPYTKSQGDVALSSETPQKVIRETKFVPVANEEKPNVAKKELVDQLISNSDQWTEDDHGALSAFTDEKIEGMISRETVVNAATKAVADGVVVNGKTHVLGEDGKWSEKPVSEPVSNCGGGCGGKKQLTAEEYLAEAPAEVRSAVANAMKIEAAAKKTIVDKLVANVDGDDAKKSLSETLSTKSLEELEAIAPLANSKPKTHTPSYVGAGGGPINNSGANKVEPLPIPTLNFSNDD